MNIGFCYEKNLKGEFIFSPLFEMLASLHVISKPEHHLDRMKWMSILAEEMPGKLIEEIRLFSTYTNEWLIIMDFTAISPYSELSIPDALMELEKMSFFRWNKVFQPYNVNTDKVAKSHILRIMKEYYDIVFRHEINFLQPFLIRVLTKELNACRKDGLLNRVNKIHERIEINENEIIFHKNKVYRFEISQLNKIVIRASTFISPHLLMGEGDKILYLTKLVEVEEKKDTVPSDLVNLLKALGDETRLKILHELRKDCASTQSLAIKLKLTEAGISKHLKLLDKAGLLDKKRQGNYVYYSMNRDAIDYIPYKLYEYIMR
ncbi:MAG: putative transcriptional regulator [Herbinix sp.]|jgi:DNA-binding transcriptional ArsR family regulator|nr:putative transcriptional regulator [Herbinix sp.]